jgi:hypothetical protein
VEAEKKAEKIRKRNQRVKMMKKKLEERMEKELQDGHLRWTDAF